MRHPSKFYAVFIARGVAGNCARYTVNGRDLVGYSAGAVGGGGLGDLAIRYGYNRFDLGVMLLTVIVLIVLVQCMQWLGDALANCLEK